MKNAMGMVGVIGLLAATCASAQDWPQWRGPNRDAKATGFTAPKAWPKELTRKWKVTIGDGVATPALVGNKLYVFSRQSGNEVVRCLNVADGKEIWQDKYETQGATGGAQGYSGPRCSPTVADGKVVFYGVRGVLSCYDAESGKKLWRKDTGRPPRFFVSSSPIVVDGLAIVQVGAENSGGLVAYDLASGNEKWKWTEDSAAYASPVLLTLDGIKAIVAETDQQIVAVNAADGKVLWQSPFSHGQMQYNSATPIVDGTTVIYSGAGRGTKAVKIEKEGDKLTAKELWSNKSAVKFNTPVFKDGLLFGLSDRNEFFCMKSEDGKTTWTAAAPASGRTGGGGGGGGGRMGMASGYGSIVDAGSVLFALTPAAQLVVFEPDGKEFKKVASYKVADGGTYAYPIISGNRVFIKDQDSLSLWTIE
jgi:outer membrane protein assembly factor BamB